MTVPEGSSFDILKKEVSDSAGHGLRTHFRICIVQNRYGYAFSERNYACAKKNRIGVQHWRTLRSRIRFSLEIGASLRWVVVWMALRTIEWAVNANWNAGSGWYVNANSVSNPNRWNADNVVFSRYSLLSPPAGGVFDAMPRYHPPSIFPVSSIWREIRA